MEKVAIITGDIVASRAGDSRVWLGNLKAVLKHYGSSPGDWEISRGDSFQLRTSPEQALINVFHIKAAIRQTGIQDARMAIGLGEESHRQKRISESNGSAYVHSGEAFETLKKNMLAVHSGEKERDDVMNLMLKLAQLTMNQWKSTTSEVIKTVIEHPEKNQKEIADILQKSQSSISEALNRGGFDEIMQVNAYFREQYS